MDGHCFFREAKVVSYLWCVILLNFFNASQTHQQFRCPFCLHMVAITNIHCQRFILKANWIIEKPNITISNRRSFQMILHQYMHLIRFFFEVGVRKRLRAKCIPQNFMNHYYLDFFRVNTHLWN